MSEEVKNVHREPHPFVGTVHMANFVGRTIAFVGKIDRVNENELIMQQSNQTQEKTDVKVIRYRNDLGLAVGQIVEVRGIVNKDKSISFGEFTAYDAEFDLGAYESMLDYYHGMCKELCCK